MHQKQPPANVAVSSFFAGPAAPVPAVSASAMFIPPVTSIAIIMIMSLFMGSL
jgi:hypothetical protein